MRRPLAALVALSIGIAACGGASDFEGGPADAAAERDAGDQVEDRDGPSTGAGNPAATGSTTDAASPPTPGAPASPGAGASAGQPSEAGRAVERDAEATLNAYLDALVSEDFGAAKEASTGSAAFLARVREVVARYNAEREGSSALSFSSRAFELRSSDASRAEFAGSATLDSTVSGPAGQPHTESALFEDPVVSMSAGAWRVEDLTFDGRSLVLSRGASRSTVGAVSMRLAGALSFGALTGVIIDLEAADLHSVRAEHVTLTYSDGTSATPKLGVLTSEPPSVFYFLFDRRDPLPTAWKGKVVVDEGTPQASSRAVTLELG